MDAILTWLFNNIEKIGVISMLVVFAALMITEKLVPSSRLNYMDTTCMSRLKDQEERHEREIKNITEDRDFHRARADRWEMASWQLGTGLSQAQTVAAGLARQAGIPAGNAADSNS